MTATGQQVQLVAIPDVLVLEAVEHLIGTQPDLAESLNWCLGRTFAQVEQAARLAAQEAAVEAGLPYPCFETTPQAGRDCSSDGYYLCEGCGRRSLEGGQNGL